MSYGMSSLQCWCLAEYLKNQVPWTYTTWTKNCWLVLIMIWVWEEALDQNWLKVAEKVVLKGLINQFPWRITFTWTIWLFCRCSNSVNPSMSSDKLSLAISKCGFMHRIICGRSLWFSPHYLTSTLTKPRLLLLEITSKNTLIPSLSSSRIWLHNLIHGSLLSTRATWPRIP